MQNIKQVQKATTPMKSLKHQFETLNGLMPYQVNVSNLNKAKPRYNPYAWHYGESSYSKGVKSDFIRIYQTQNSNISVGLAFSYLDGNTPQVMATKRTVNGKDKDHTWAVSAPMTIETCRHALNLLIKNMQSANEVSYDMFIQLFAGVFLESDLKDSDEVKEAIANYNELLVHEKNQLEKYHDEDTKIKASLADAKERYRDIIDESDEQAEVNRISAELKKAQNKLSQRREKEQQSLGIKSLTSQRKVIESQIYALKSTISGKKSTFMKKFSLFMRKAIDPSYD